MGKERVKEITSDNNCLNNQKTKSSNFIDNYKFINKSKKLAMSHEWLYHCTTADAFKSILKNKEFWLSNLKVVNDEEEVERIDVEEFKNTFYVGCFTYDSKILQEHWEEYGNVENGVLVAIRSKWFIRDAVFMYANNQKCTEEIYKIMKNYDATLEYKINTRSNANMFYIREFDFYQIIYDDNLKKEIKGYTEFDISDERLYGTSIVSEVAGIIKSTRGVCKRAGKESYEKDWTTEKEVRLKVCIPQNDPKPNGNRAHDATILQKYPFPKIAVPISDDAFDIIKIKFSPRFKDKDGFLRELRKIKPASDIEII